MTEGTGLLKKYFYFLATCSMSLWKTQLLDNEHPSRSYDKVCLSSSSWDGGTCDGSRVPSPPMGTRAPSFSTLASGRGISGPAEPLGRFLRAEAVTEVETALCLIRFQPLFSPGVASAMAKFFAASMSLASSGLRQCLM